jgi:tripartite-type tricarboxylate transporter receptor subunit TctC
MASPREPEIAAATEATPSVQRPSSHDRNQANAAKFRSGALAANTLLDDSVEMNDSVRIGPRRSHCCDFEQSVACRSQFAAFADRDKNLRGVVMMKLPRREFLHLAAGAATLSAASPLAWADTYPSRPVRIVVGYAAGGAPDILARLVGQWLSHRLGQPFVVENRPGANGTIAIETVMKAAADGYTLLALAVPDAVNATLYPSPNYNFVRDVAPVAATTRDPDVMVVNASFSAKTVPEFINFAKANPGKINMASPGVGSSPHMAGELFKYMTGIEMTHVAYRGSAPAITDLLGGQVQVYFAPISASLAYIKAGKLRALAVTTATRAQALPDVPTVSDFVPGYEVSAWYGIGAPRNTRRNRRQTQ